MVERTFKVIGKGLKGENEDPVVTLKGDKGEKLTLCFPDKRSLDAYEIEQYFTVKIEKEQRTLDHH